ncbi:MCE family protein [Nocardia xishanensis]|uniref:MCE family protein n=1 Tax=Nocardia xishanensis TaxID=238964 RepID=UPI000829ADC2|nr:MCE family protein [Nocardia xishanensis]
MASVPAGIVVRLGHQGLVFGRASAAIPFVLRNRKELLRLIADVTWGNGSLVVGGGLPERADVKFRGMLVGASRKSPFAAKGERQNVFLDLKHYVAPSIPESMTARVLPANIFGVTAIELVDNDAAPRGLRQGAVIRQDASAATTQLRTTLTTLRTVLDRIQPAKLGRVLGTLADAMDPAARAGLDHRTSRPVGQPGCARPPESATCSAISARPPPR